MRRWSALGIALTLAMTGSPALAGAGPDLSVMAKGHIIADDDLAEMRGRYVQAGQVRYFGFQMYSLWQAGDGMWVSAGLNFSFNPGPGDGAAGPAEPPKLVATYVYSCPSCPASDSAPADTAIPVIGTVGPGAIGQTKGTVQTITLSGDDNRTRNDMRLNIVRDAAPGSVIAPAGPAGVAQNIAGTTVISFPTGGALRFLVGENALGIAIDRPGQGSLTQEIRGSGPGHIAQHIDLTSDRNRVTNVMSLDFVLGSMASRGAVDLGPALDAVRRASF